MMSSMARSSTNGTPPQQQVMPMLVLIVMLMFLQKIPLPRHLNGTPAPRPRAASATSPLHLQGTPLAAVVNGTPKPIVVARGWSRRCRAWPRAARGSGMRRRARGACFIAIHATVACIGTSWAGASGAANSKT